MRQTISVVLVDPDDEFQVVADSRDVRRWESGHGESFMGQVSFTKLAELAHLAAVRTGAFVGSWEAFDGRCVDAEGATDEDEGRPTRPGRTDGLSARSPSGSGSSRPPSRPKARTSSSPSPTSSPATPTVPRMTA